MPRCRVTLLALFVVVLAAGCTAHPATPSATASAPSDPGRPQASTTLPAAATTVVPGTDAIALAVGTSRALFARSPAVVLVAASDPASLTRATTVSADLGVPLLLTPVAPGLPGSPGPTGLPGTSAAPGSGDAGADVRAELTRLAPRTIVTVGVPAAAWEQAQQLPGPVPTVTLAPDSVDQAALPDVIPPPPLSSLLVLAVTGAASTAALATAKAAGARVLAIANPDPRTSAEAIKALTAARPTSVLAVGAAFGAPDRLRSRIDTAATGVELPGGGQVVFPGRRMIALYGHPGATSLGVLGEQPLDATIARAKAVAAAYSSLVDEPVVPAFDLITTVASSGAGSDGNYSNESSVAELKPWVDAARAAGIYVVLDLQPGRTDFLTQAKLYADLLLSPNVGLALDPEWRLKPDQVHLKQIGTVDAAEINATGQWLAELTRAHNLPQKVFMVHQFRLDMITNRTTMVTDYDQLRVVIHVDGFGSPGAKNSTWNTLHVNAPANVDWGWKNFYDEDKPTFTPQQTMAQSPKPVFVSYQ